MNKFRIEEKKVSLFCMCISFFFVTSGADIMAIPIGGFQITISRAFGTIAILSLLAYKCKYREDLKMFEIKNRYSVVFLLFWFLYAIFTLLWAHDISAYLKSLYFLIYGIVTVLFLIDVYSKENIEKLSISYILGIAFQSLIGWYEIITRDYRYLTENNATFFARQEEAIPIAMLGNPNNYATVMYIAFFEAIILAKTCSNKIKSLLWYAMAINFAFMIYKSDSRAVLIGLIIAIAVMLWLAWSGSMKCMVTILCISGLPFAVNKILEKVDFSYFTTKGESFEMRKNLIKNGLYFVTETFGFGTGSGQLDSWFRENAVYYIKNYTSMHNYWMEILASYGIIIFALFMIFYIKMMYDFYKYGEGTEGSNKILGQAITGGLVGFVIAAVSSSSNFTQEYIWAGWAIIIAMQGHLQYEKTAKLYLDTK